jgi:23S rRNA (adenine1618-N6)-methyltransferase
VPSCTEPVIERTTYIEALSAAVGRVPTLSSGEHRTTRSRIAAKSIPSPQQPWRHAGAGLTAHSLKPASKTPNHTKGELHARNLHRAPYDFPRLIAHCPELKAFLQPHPLGGDTIDFADPEAVVALNRALLKAHYGIAHWDLPVGFLCPPIPSRADYLHHVADLIAADHGGVPPHGPRAKVIDIGVGANCIYPLLGVHAYGWHFVGSERDRVSADWARRLVEKNSLTQQIEIRVQPSRERIFEGVARAGEAFILSLSNPPFHASPEEAEAGTLRKLRNLGGGRPAKAVLNFGGRGNELWCEGGEIAFVQRMIAESASRPDLCVWFTTLVSKRGSLPALERALGRVRAADVRTLTMFAGQKQSRILAWTFLTPKERHARLAVAG